MTLRSSRLGLRAKIFMKKVSKQSRLSFKVRQGVPLFTHVQNRTTLAEVALKIQKKGEGRHGRSCLCPSVCRSAPVWQKLPYRHTRGGHGRSCLSPKMCRSARSGRSALELQKKSDVAKFATVQACAEVHHSHKRLQNKHTRRETEFHAGVFSLVSCDKLAQ